MMGLHWCLLIFDEGLWLRFLCLLCMHVKTHGYTDTLASSNEMACAAYLYESMEISSSKKAQLKLTIWYYWVHRMTQGALIGYLLILWLCFVLSHCRCPAVLEYTAEQDLIVFWQGSLEHVNYVLLVAILSDLMLLLTGFPVAVINCCIG